MPEEVQIGYWGKSLPWKGGQAVGQAAQDSGGVIVPGRVQKLPRDMG